MEITIIPRVRSLELLATYTLTFPSEFDLSGLTSSSCSTTSFNLEIHSCVIDHEARQIQMSMTIENTFFFVVS